MQENTQELQKTLTKLESKFNGIQHPIPADDHESIITQISNIKVWLSYPLAENIIKKSLEDLKEEIESL